MATTGRSRSCRRFTARSSNQRRRYREAREYFNRSLAFWTDDLPDPSSIEAKAYIGLLDALEGKNAAGRSVASQALEQARKIKFLSLEARCRLIVAAIDVQAKNYDAVRETLEPLGGQVENRLGPEILVRKHFLSGQALAGRNDQAGADREVAIARTKLEQLTRNIDDGRRKTLLARPDLQQIVR